LLIGTGFDGVKFFAGCVKLGISSKRRISAPNFKLSGVSSGGLSRFQAGRVAPQGTTRNISKNPENLKFALISFDGFQFFITAASLDILGNNLVSGLGLAQNCAHKNLKDYEN